MWKISRKTASLTIAAAFLITMPQGHAQESHYDSRQYGLNLPNTPLPQGFDEVRAADGTTCRSAIASNGPYLDLGGIGADGRAGANGSATVYGRMIIPVGRAPDRVNCRSLYQLEIDRLKYELRLARMGVGSEDVTGTVKKSSWADEGWKTSDPGQTAIRQATAQPRFTLPPVRKSPKVLTSTEAELEKLNPWR